MNSDLSQQNFPDPSSASAVFSSDPAGVKEIPGSPYYADGVEVGYTAPAKWWNWLWNHISAWLKDSKADKESMRAEALNVLSEASITPSSTDEHQLSKGINGIAYDTAERYDMAEVTEVIDSVTVTHKVNQPYVVGHTLYVPDTELL